MVTWSCLLQTRSPWNFTHSHLLSSTLPPSAAPRYPRLHLSVLSSLDPSDPLRTSYLHDCKSQEMGATKQTARKSQAKPAPARIPTHPPWVEMIKVRYMVDSPPAAETRPRILSRHLRRISAVQTQLPKAGQVGWIVVDRAH